MRNSPQVLSVPGANQRPRRKIVLKPGYSPLDWARLSASGKDLRGVNELRRVTMDEVALHNKRNDCWMVISGNVYNVTHYLDYHPGGKGELMRAAGKDGTDLFNDTHPWVNAEGVLRECMIGFCTGPGALQAEALESSDDDSGSA
ncbi:hypothetical protein GGI04_003065 [Coemansia thaxteri]|uniref:Cytochrome b5 heme-binding domain-containing protein n=1 Tax=Coemansia thaxteri TaxID=2663907 RepID=A0A9W8BG24_9FUNG|nr:hypothetical protein H4R26_004956 [Coemansia thaxteri]KAJ2003167.1 hypothetical protein GGI04_003065 [Coemansia thaxteri]KAJ2470459.1 hypothetical protein GGI02_002914 [Coemansia sp. RSA 2322]KAJ2470961.1 hypothetical protein EV174_006030 [Coemansia sp. RSA 2320]